MRAAGFHTRFRNGPGRAVQIELRPGRLAQLTRANGSQHQQTDGAAGQGVERCRFDLAQQLGQFGKGNVRMVAGGFRRCGHHVQIGGRVGFDYATSQTEAEYLV